MFERKILFQVTDTNDNPPTFLENAYSFDIPENAVRGSRVGQVRASDPDLGTNAHLTYTVISDWANDVFSLNPQTGVFTLTARLDYEEVSFICPAIKTRYYFIAWNKITSRNNYRTSTNSSSSRINI